MVDKKKWRYCTFVPPPPIVIDDSSWKNTAESFTVALTLSLPRGVGKCNEVIVKKALNFFADQWSKLRLVTGHDRPDFQFDHSHKSPFLMTMIWPSNFFLRFIEMINHSHWMRPTWTWTLLMCNKLHVFDIVEEKRKE